MIISDGSERVSLHDVAAELGVHATTVYWWSNRGVRGHKLPSFYIGSRRHTTRAKLDEFLRAINQPATPTPHEPAH
jgi:transposase